MMRIRSTQMSYIQLLHAKLAITVTNTTGRMTPSRQWTYEQRLFPRSAGLYIPHDESAIRISDQEKSCSVVVPLIYFCRDENDRRYFERIQL